VSTGSIAIRAISLAEHWLPSKTKSSVAQRIEVEGTDQEVSHNKKRAKSVAYYCPEWWESHHCERR
jgi:hypothetical protein